MHTIASPERSIVKTGVILRKYKKNERKKYLKKGDKIRVKFIDDQKFSRSAMLKWLLES